MRMLYPVPRALPVSSSFPPVKSVAVSTDDRTRFEFWLLPAHAPRGLILMCHGYHASRFQVLDMASSLSARGYTTLLFDLRGHGTRRAEPCTFGKDELRDLGAILNWRRADPLYATLPLGVMGVSWGGAFACQAADRYQEVKALVLDSTYARLFPILARVIRRDYHLPSPFAWITWFCTQAVLAWPLGPKDPLAFARRAHLPCLMIHGEADQSVPLDDDKQLYTAWQGPKSQWIEPGAGHVVLSSVSPSTYCHRLVQFFDQWLLAHPA